MLYLIDSSIYVFRSWQSLPASIVNSHGEQSNAVQGFTAMLGQVLTDIQPEYIVCAFDKSARVGKRNEIYPEYKMNREEAPPELKIQFDRCIQVATAMGIPCFGSTEVEADDIIGSFARIAQKSGMPVTVVSADKDLAQFITEDDIYWNYAKQTRQTYAQLIKQFRIRPDQIADMLALCGDKVDNIPGIPGVGQTTASRLLKKFGTLDNVIENRALIAKMSFRGAPRVAVLVDEYQDTVRLARQLTGLITDASLPKTLTKLKRKKVSAKKMATDLQNAGVSEQRALKLAGNITGKTA